MSGLMLALDLGTKCGYAASAGTGATISGTMGLSPKRFEGGGMRYLRFKRWLDELHAAQAIGEIVFEEVRGHKGVDAAHVYGGLMAHLMAWCEENTVPCRGVPVQHIKKYATGRGNAPKQLVIDAVRGWGYEPCDDNEADALALLHMQLTERGDPLDASSLLG
jgi:Holliday junction resolvasome RuvABC endonuclease subunit